MKLIIGGDVSIKEDCEQLFKDENVEELFRDITQVFKSADRTLINLECAVTEKDTPIKKIGPNLKAPLNTVETLKKAGVTDAGLANNHIFDFGKAGLKDTVELLEKFGINYTGIGENDIDARKNLIISDGKIKIAVIAVCEHEYSYALPDRVGTRAYDPYDTNDDIALAKQSADYVIVTYHGGKEECRYPSERLVKACRSMIKHGADVVLCQHSHCIGCYEQFNGGHILYGQGNFHFICKRYENKEDKGYMWNTGLLVALDIDKNGLKIDFLPTIVDGNGVRLCQGEEKEKILSELKERSLSLKDGSYKERFREFCFTKPGYLFIPEEKREKFAHYLDCEAHTDVWREVYTTYNRTNEKD